MWLSLLSLWSWEHVPVAAAGADPPARARAALRLFVRLLGAPDARRAVDRLGAAPAASQSRSASRSSAPAPKTRCRSSRGRASSRSLDRGLHPYERKPVASLRRRALRAAERWVVERQEADGSWGGIQPPWVWSIVALHALGYPLDHPVIERALAGLDSFTIEDEQGRRIEACQSPVWDTALAVLALLDAGFDPGHEAVARGARWLAGREVRVRGDWSVRRPDLAPGGFPFEFANDNYPDVDDTAVVVLALRRAGIDDGGAAERGVAWSLGMQSSDGGWAAFDADNTSSLPAKLPFCDFGAVTDPPSADVTAHMVEMLAYEGRTDERATQRGIEWLLREQEPDGSWFGRWGANHVYGTGAVLPALAQCGLARTSRACAPPSAGSSACRTTTAASARTCAPIATPRGAVAANRPRRRPRGRCSASTRRASTTARPPSARSAGSSRPSAATAAGTSPISPAPAFPATSTSTTTSTGRSSP